jgi:hypothetical protein
MYIPFWEGTAALSFLNRGDMLAGAVTFNHVQGLLLLVGLEYAATLLFIKVAAYGGFVLFYLRGAWQLCRSGSHNLFDLPLFRRAGAWLRARIGDSRLARAGVAWWVREESPPGEAEDDLSRLVRVSFGVLVFFTLYSSLYYQPWYLTWPLLFLSFMLAPRYKWHLLTLTVVSVITTMGFVFV